MKKSLLIAAAVVAMSGVAAMAEGLPSQAKLAKLGLGGMQVASDEAGSAVRGKFFGSAGFLFESYAQDKDSVFTAPPVPPAVVGITTINRAGAGGITGFAFGQAPRSLGASASAEGGTLQEATVNSTETTVVTSVQPGPPASTVTTTTVVTTTGLTRINNPYVAQVTNTLTGGTYTAYSSGGMFFRGN